MKINRNSKRQLKRDISFINEILDFVEDRNSEGCETLLTDWKHELEMYHNQPLVKKRQIKRFRYYEIEEGGMYAFDVKSEKDMRGLCGWKSPSCVRADELLEKQMTGMEVGEYVQHRMGELVRLK